MWYLNSFFPLLPLFKWYKCKTNKIPEIQLNSVYFVWPNITNYKFASKGFSLYTCDIPVPGPHRKNSQEIVKTLSRRKKGKKPSGEQQRRIPFPRRTEAIYAMCTEGSTTELQHNQ